MLRYKSSTLMFNDKELKVLAEVVILFWEKLIV